MTIATTKRAVAVSGPASAPYVDLSWMYSSTVLGMAGTVTK
eukprot:CAMPEP_0170198286 /NCGR_PEP_ID=MMETSP0040_2-20121228/68503_1 /TAXON_ID=641309 /ORGANISM="Lotharella oceanica, Strain CCMP622" /LENGTH=40 /DNA_ID= /DNA_START= /DNA_END= /DNA_ORIENTATION=